MSKVIGAGFGRTGTMSLKIALERLLGGPCYHMVVVIEERPEDIARWRAAGRGEPVDWASWFADFPALVDWPVARFYRELHEAFPDAKFILTVRDPDSWYASALASIWEMSQTMKRFPTSALMPLMGARSKFTTMGDEVIWGHHFGDHFEDAERTKAVFRKHIEDVQAAIPKEQLLVFDVRDGWEPLCEFLGVDAPDEPFPRSNETAAFERRIRITKLVSWSALGFAASAAAGIVYALSSLL